MGNFRIEAVFEVQIHVQIHGTAVTSGDTLYGQNKVFDGCHPARLSLDRTARREKSCDAVAYRTADATSYVIGRNPLINGLSQHVDAVLLHDRTSLRQSRRHARDCVWTAGA